MRNQLGEVGHMLKDVERLRMGEMFRSGKGRLEKKEPGARENDEQTVQKFRQKQ